MIALFCFAIVIAIATVWFIAHPLRSATEESREDREALLQLRDRLIAQLREIDVEAGDRNIDAVIVGDERRRLDADLARVLKELDGTEAKGTDEARRVSPRLWLTTILILVALLPLASVGLYFAHSWATFARLGRPVAVANNGIPPQVLEMVGRLERRLAEQPRDPQGWARLGRAYHVLGRVPEARVAYSKAIELAPDDPEIMNAYGGFLMSLDPSRPNPEAVVIFERLLKRNPKHPGALWTLGLVAFQQQKFGQAVKYWEQLRAVLPPDNDVSPQIQRAIDTARAQAKAKK